MAEANPSSGTPAAKKPGPLSGSWHGVPKPAIAVVGVAGVYFVYKRVKSKGSSATPAAPAVAATPTCSATPSCSGSGYPGSGQGSGGGSSNPNMRNHHRGSAPTPSPAPAPAPAPATPTCSASAPAAPAPAPAPSPVPQTAAPAAQIGSTPTAGTFKLPKGSISFQPTVAVSRGGQVAYGIPNAPTAKELNTLGGLVESGTALMAKGWTNLTPTADYLVR